MDKDKTFWQRNKRKILVVGLEFGLMVLGGAIGSRIAIQTTDFQIHLFDVNGKSLGYVE